MSEQASPAISVRPSRTRGLLRVLVLLAAVLWIATAVWESREEGLLKPGALSGTAARLTTGGTSQSDKLLEVDTTPEPVDVGGLLPSSIEGWIVQGPQPVPGTTDVYELVLTPRDDERSLVTPLACYLQMAVSDKADISVEAIRDSRYPVDPGTAPFGSIVAITGWSSDRQSYFMGWHTGDVSVGIDSSFTYSHASPDYSLLRTSAEEIAEKVLSVPGRAGE